MYISFFCVDFFALGTLRKPVFRWNIGGVGCLALGLCVGHVHFMRQVTQTLPNANPFLGGIWALGFQNGEFQRYLLNIKRCMFANVKTFCRFNY